MAEVDFSTIPLIALSSSTNQILSNLLNSSKILLSEKGHFRDWRGVADLAKIYFVSLKNESNPMAKVIDIWSSSKTESSTFGTLIQFLENIDRYDVVDDIREFLAKDAKNFMKKHKSPPNISVPSIDVTDYSKELEMLTKDDVCRAEQGLPLQQYDAFLLYADEDINYAHEMLNRLESSKCNPLKLCVKDRDLLAGISFEHEAVTKLIEERCHRVIVILTSSFLRSPANSFLINYTQVLQIQQRKRKIVPCLYEENMDIPRTLKIYFFLKYIPDGMETAKPLYNFWEKLSISIRNVSDRKTDTPLSVVGTAVGSSLEKENTAMHTTKRTLMVQNHTLSVSVDDGLKTQKLKQSVINFDDVPTKIHRCGELNKSVANSNDSNEYIQSSHYSLEHKRTSVNDTLELSKTSKRTLKKEKKWLKTWRKNTNTWLKKHLSSS